MNALEVRLPSRRQHTILITPQAIPSTHKIRLLTPRSRRPHHKSNNRPKHIHIRRTPQHTTNPVPLLLSRILLTPHAPPNIQLWHLHRLQHHPLPPRPQPRPNPQTTPTIPLIPRKKPRESHIHRSTSKTRSLNHQGTRGFSYFSYLRRTSKRYVGSLPPVGGCEQHCTSERSSTKHNPLHALHALGMV